MGNQPASPPKTLFLACSALSKDVRAIIHKYGWDADFRPVDSRHHLYPSRIEREVEAHLNETDGLYERRVVVYGHCGAQNLDAILARHEGAVRPVGPHCYEMYGGDDFRKAVKEEPGTYILTDYLIHAWNKLIVKGLKLDKHPKLTELMFAHYRRMIYYSQDKDNAKLLSMAREIADSLGLELQVRHVGYGDLERRLVAIMEGRPQPGADAETADYAYPVAESAGGSSA
ncbi:MAG: DUF1638 domain-containing protein [Gammaproteobacteria bacterium]